MGKKRKKKTINGNDKSVLAWSYTLEIPSRIIQCFLPEYSLNVDISIKCWLSEGKEVDCYFDISIILNFIILNKYVHKYVYILDLPHWKRLWCWEGLGAGGEGDDPGWDDWMASLTQWTWVWVNSGSWWWTGRPGVLQFMGSQRVGHHWATELNWTQELNLASPVSSALQVDSYSEHQESPWILGWTSEITFASCGEENAEFLVFHSEESFLFNHISCCFPSLIIYNISFFSLEITPCSILQPTYGTIVIVSC